MALMPKKPGRPRRRVLDGRAEAHLIALSCSDPPEGRERWSMRLLADRMVELGHVDTVSHETIRRPSSGGWRKFWISTKSLTTPRGR